MIELRIDFDCSEPQETMNCHVGKPMPYGSFIHHFAIGKMEFKIPNTPAWMCPDNCFQKGLGCKGSEKLLRDSIGDQIIKVVEPYYQKH
ncbi:MAG: hypothetical protein Q7R97_00335 [Candidatus Daviesbacteria bacterium]|nr:hypothetical protein [Candidatus Daviesbacteria bacterium]